MANILIIKLGALGDMVMATPLIKQIQNYHENDNLWLLTTPEFTDIFKNWKGLNIIAFNRKGLIDFFRTASWIRKNKFDRIYDLQSNDRTSIFCSLAGAREIVGNHPRFPYKIHPPGKYTGQCHIYYRMLSVLQSAGMEATFETPCLPVTDKDHNYVNEWLQEKRLQGKPLVIIHAGASFRHPEKCWPYFSDLAEFLDHKGFSIIWTGAGADAAPNKLLSTKTGIDATNVFSICQLAELGRHARFAITNDSGPMHVLSASGIPVISIFGPTSWQRNHAIGQEKNVITLNKEAGFKPVPLGRINADLVIAHLEHSGLV